LMEECSFSRNQDTNHNPRDVEDSNFSTCPSCTLCCLSLDLSISLEILEFQIWHPFKEAQNWNTYNGQEKNKLVSTATKCHWKINVQFIMDQTNVEWLD
jgi:hypothetical protein